MKSVRILEGEEHINDRGCWFYIKYGVLGVLIGIMIGFVGYIVQGQADGSSDCNILTVKFLLMILERLTMEDVTEATLTHTIVTLIEVITSH